MLHEAIYFWMRKKHGEEDSVRARHVTAILMSDLQRNEMRAKLADALKGMDPPFQVPDPSDEVDDTAGFFIHVRNAGNRGVLHRASANYGEDASTENMTTPCKITNSSSESDRDILCLLEMEELDLYFTNLGIQYHVPSTMCSYLRFTPPSFYAYEAGIGPARVSHQVLADGSIVDRENSKNGVPVCQYDHRNSAGGPNCCEGTFTQVITIFAEDGSSSTVSTQGVPWGGSASQCLAGPAMTDAWAPFRNQQGFPTSRMDFVEGTGFNTQFELTSAMDTYFAGQTISSNLWAANFYQPSAFPGGKPAAFQRPATLPRTPEPKDTYQWECLDRSGDLKARIRLMIREWNSGPILEGGNPDIGENSYLDWLDIGNTFPETRL